MARVPGRAQELPLRSFAGVLLLFAFLILVAPPRAQGQDLPAPPDEVIEGFVELSLRLASVHGETAPVLGAAGLLGVSAKWRAGGGGFSMIDRVSLEIPPALQKRDVHLGYGGLLVERELVDLSGAPGSARAAALLARVLIGAGNAEVLDAATGTRLSDNFALIEPSVSVQAPLSGVVSAGVSAGYRVVGGVDGLRGIEEAHLRGWSLGLHLRLGPF